MPRASKSSHELSQAESTSRGLRLVSQLDRHAAWSALLALAQDQSHTLLFLLCSGCEPAEGA